MTPSSVLVVMTRRLGDVLFATPVIASLRAAWPDAAIDALVFSGTEGVLARHPALRRVLTVRERADAAEHRTLVRSIFRQYDLGLSLLCGDRPVLYARLAGRRALAPTLPGAKHWWKRSLLSDSVPFDGQALHTVLMNLSLATRLGAPARAEVALHWNAEDRAAVMARLPFPPTAPFVILHPSPRFTYKAWHASGWRELACWVRARGFRVVVSGGPGDEERAFAAALATSVPDTTDVCGRLDLPATACLVSHARGYVGPDTVVTHIAAAAGVPTVALFGPSSPVVWGPWPRGHELTNPYRLTGTQQVRNVLLVQGEGDCVPCLKEGCARRIDSDSECLKGISGATVIRGFAQLLGVPE
ncbi:MAG: glycosyltransferase family 9 protein [Acidiferrobacteraceae bacterium]